MRLYRCTDLSNKEVDLDDPETYKGLPTDCNELDAKIFKWIGYAHCYVTYFHPDWGQLQKERIKLLTYRFCSERHNHYDNVLWLQEILFLFIDETENMC